MSEIKYIWHVPEPAPIKKWQALLFVCLFPLVFSINYGLIGGIISFFAISTIFYFKIQIIFLFIHFATYFIYGIIHLLNLVLLAIVFVFVITPTGLIKRMAESNRKKKEDFDITFFSKSEKITEDHFTRPY